MADGNVQRGTITDFGATKDSTTDTITSVSTSNAFARLTSMFFTSAGPTAGDSLGRDNNELGCTCLLTDATTVTFTMDAGRTAAEDVTLAYEVIEFPGTGDDAAIVRMHENKTLSSGTATADFAISGVSDIDNLVPIICGIQHKQGAETNNDRGLVTLEIVDNAGSEELRITRGDGTFDIIVSVAVVEFTGANWRVQNNVTVTQTTADTVETTTITATTWANTMIFSGLRTTVNVVEAQQIALWNGATTTTMKNWSSYAAGATVIAHIVENANLAVEHINSFDGSETNIDVDGSDPWQGDKTISTSTLADHFVIVHGATAATTSAHYLFGEAYWLQSTTTLRFWNYRTNSNSDWDWAAQLVDVSGLTESTSSTDVNLHGTGRGVMRGLMRGVG